MNGNIVYVSVALCETVLAKGGMGYVGASLGRRGAKCLRLGLQRNVARKFKEDTSKEATMEGRKRGRKKRCLT